MNYLLRYSLFAIALICAPFFAQAQLSGSYTIGGSGASYSTITSALSALSSSGVSGPVVFTINAGNYSEDINLTSAINGASKTNTITFRGVGKYRVVLSESYPVYLSNCDFVKVENVTLNASRYGVYLNYSDYCVIENCLIKAAVGTSSSSYMGAYVYRSNYDTVRNNRIVGGYYSLYVYGSGSSYNNNIGNVFEGNDLVKGYYYGVMNYYAKDNKYYSNRIDSLYSTSNVYLFYDYRSSGTQIERNQLYYTNQYYYGIYCYYTNYYGSSSARTRIVNNFIGGDVSTYMYGVYVARNSRRIDILNNTIVSNGNSTSSICLYVGSGNNHNVQNNNLYQMSSSGGYAAYVSSASYVDTMDYNNIHSENSSYYTYFSGTRSSLTALKGYSTKYNQNTIDVGISISDTRDHKLETVELNNKGNRWVGVTDDISGNTRPAKPDTLMDIGCSDYFLPDVDAGISKFLESPLCAGTSSAKAYLKNFGTKNLTSCKLNWAISVNGGSFTTQKAVNFSGKLTPGSDLQMTLGTFTLVKGNSYTLKAWTSSPNSQKDIKSSNDTSFTTKKPAMSGTYTVGSSGADFSSIDSAFLALRANKICGPVILRLPKKTFSGQLIIRDIPGASATNYVRIVGQGKGQTIISHTASNSSNWATVLFDGADHIILDSMSILAKGTNYGATTWFTNGANNNIVKNCELSGNVSSGSSNHSNVVFSATSNGFSYGTSGQNNTISNNTIRGGYWGVAMYGSNGSSFSEYTSGNTIANNRIYQSYNYGVYAYRTRNKLIEGNDMDSFRYSNGYGIYNYYCGNDRVIANRIKSPSIGIYTRYANYDSYGATKADSSFYINNMISGQAGYCMYSYYGFRTMFYNNSFSSASNSSYACYFRYNYYSEWKNNSFQTLGTSYCVYWYRIRNIASGAIDYNNYHAPNSNYLVYASGSRTSLSAIQSGTGGDVNSILADPEYNSLNDLHSLSINLNNKGVKLGYVKTDFDGEARPFAPDTLYDIGADEYNLPPYDLDIRNVYPTVFASGTNKIRLLVRNTGINDIINDTAVVSYTINGGTAVKDTLFINGKLARGDDTTFVFATPYIVSGTSGITLCATIEDGIRKDPDTNEKMCINACVGAAGTYTINASGSGDFKTFSEAMSFLGGCGVGGSVTIKVDSGVYKERVVIPEIAGASATNTITFDGQDSAVIEYDGSSSANSVVFLNGAKYVTVKNFTIRNTDAYYSVGVQIGNGSSEVRVKNNVIRPSSSASSSYSGGVILSSRADGYIFDALSSNGTECYIEGNDISGGYTGVCFRGANTNDYTKNIYVLNNKIQQFYYYGVYAYYSENIHIDGNSVKSSRHSSAYAIHYAYSHDGSVSANEVSNVGYMGIYLYRLNYYRTGDIDVHNNMIYGPFANSSQYFMYLYNSNNLNLYHNTLYNSTETSYYMIYARYCNNSSWINNIVANLQTSGSIYPVYISSGSFDTLDYNNVFSKGTYYVYHNAQYNNLSSWQTGQSSYNENSISEAPLVVSSSNPHLGKTKDSPRGLPLGLPTDVDGDSRCLFAPTIGADESGFILPSTRADFSADDTIYVNSPANIINATSITTPGEHKWYVDDTLRSKKHNLTYTFTKTGYDTVKLVTTGCSGVDSISKRVYIGSPTRVPVSDFVSLKNQIDPFDDIKLFDLSTNGPTDWEWNITPRVVYSPVLGYWTNAYGYSNGTDSTSQNPEIIFYESGKFTVSLVAKNHIGSGNRETKVSYIEVAAIAQMCNYFPANSNAASGRFYDDGGPTQNYSDNNNGVNICGYLIDPCASDVTLTFESFDVRSGSYEDYLRIYDGEDNTGTPLWDISSKPKGFNGTLASIDTSYTAKSGKMYIEFESDRRYNSAGWEAKWTSTPGNFAAPVAKFAVPDTVCDNSWFFMEVDTGTNVYANYAINFGSASHYEVKGGHMLKFLSAGKEDITLTVDNCGGIDSTTKTVTIISPKTAPKPDFEADILRPTTTDIVTIFDKSYRCVDEVQWLISPSNFEFVNGTDSASLAPQVQFKGTGCYDVTLIAGKNSKYDTLTRTCYIDVIQYCGPTVGNLISDIGISRVKLDQIDNSSDVGLVRYTDYTAKHKTGLQVGGKYEVIVERDRTLNYMNRAVWIDWNQDGDFDDTLEVIGKEPSNKTLSWSQSFTVPNTNVAKLGATRMRVGTNIGKLKNSPCGPNAFGEFEDYRVNITPDLALPVIELNGLDSVTIERCRTYSDPGITATDNVTVASNLVTQVVDRVDKSKLGTYEILYYVTDEAKNTAVARRVVEVTADTTAPDMTLKGNATTYHPVLSTYNDSGATALDLCDGILTTQITNGVNENETGIYFVKYTATDKAGNSGSITRTVIVEDKVKPTIKINGLDTVYIEVHTSFVDDGYVANDNYDSNPAVTVLGEVNTSKLGTYTITYSVVDEAGNDGEDAHRVVVVVDTTQPTVLLNGDTTEIVDVFDKFIDLRVDYQDNYWSSNDMDMVIKGSFYTAFPNGIPNALGTYQVEYHVTDGSGNTAIVVREVKVVDREAPVIDIEDILKICRWDSEADQLAGVTANDNYYSASEITITIAKSDIDIHEDGFYSIRYQAEDGSGNKAESSVRMAIVEHCNVSLDQLEPLDDAITLYPNPTSGQVAIQIDLEEEKDLTISISNIQGKIVETIQPGLVSKATYQRNLSQYGTGVYLIRIKTESTTLVKRVEVIK